MPFADTLLPRRTQQIVNGIAELAQNWRRDRRQKRAPRGSALPV